MALRTVSLGLSLALLSSMPARSQPQQPAPTVTSARDGILAAFGSHPLVGIADIHGLAQEEDFYVSLLQDPRFAKEVGNVVVEFGDSSQQSTVDRYEAGDEVPYDQLRRVWADTVGWVPTVTSLGYVNFFAAVRDANRSLPQAQRIHVWLGGPPVDWSAIKSSADLSKVEDRDRFAAELIESAIVAKNRKALLLFGGGHFSGNNSMAEAIGKKHPGALFVVTPYFGFATRTCSDDFEAKNREWPKLALATPVRKTSLEGELRTSGCHFVDASDFSFDKAATEEQKANAIARTDYKVSGLASDALLYLGPASSLTQAPLQPDLYIDDAFRREIGRRFQIITGQAMTWPSTSDNPVSPRYMRPYGGLPAR